MSDTLNLRALEARYDGAIPAEWVELANTENYHHYLVRLAQAAEYRFYTRLRDTLMTLAAWRLTPHPYQSYHLRMHGKILTLCRHKAREAFDLCG